VDERVLIWDGCVNVRDLGGHPTAAGATTRFRRVVRADSVRQLSEAGWEALVAYGIRTVVDLRLPSERDADPPAELPVEVVHAPFLGEHPPEEWEEIESIGAAAGDDHATATRDVYLALLDRNRERVAAAVTAVATAPEGGVLVHCHAGKDRTGLVTAFLLDLAGVGRNLIAEDYALSGTMLARVLADWVDEAPDDVERARRLRLSATPARAMLGVLEALDARNGGPRGFLRAGGAADADLERAAARLLD
jgi:protein tyrosine/serine phosphatase